MLVTIRSTARRDEEAEEPVTLITSGRLTLTGDRMVLQYDETLDETLPAQHVTITIANGAMDMVREGEYAMCLVFHKGRRYEGKYETPFGAMGIAVFCTRLRYELNEAGGEIYVSYQMDLNDRFAAMHDMEIRMVAQDG